MFNCIQWYEVTHMAKATIRYLDEKKRRIVIPKEIAEVEDLHEGDYIEIDVKKIQKALPAQGS